MRPVPYTIGHATALSRKLRKADLIDLHQHEQDPRAALSYPLETGDESWAVMDGDAVIGAGGWTRAGSVWTLWADLSMRQSRELLRMTPAWARIISIRSKGRILGNVFRKGNRLTQHWLEMSGCVDIHHETPLTSEWGTFIPFRLKPLERLPNV